LATSSSQTDSSMLQPDITKRKDNIYSKPIRQVDLSQATVLNSRPINLGIGRQIAERQPEAAIKAATESVQETREKVSSIPYNAMPLIYLANPDMLLGDLGVPGFDTSAGMRYRYNSAEGSRNKLDMGLELAPSAALNVGLSMIGIPEGNMLSKAGYVANNAINPLAGVEDLMKAGVKQYAKEASQTTLKNPSISTSNSLRGPRLEKLAAEAAEEAKEDSKIRKVLNKANNLAEEMVNHIATSPVAKERLKNLGIDSDAIAVASKPRVDMVAHRPDEHEVLHRNAQSAMDYYIERPTKSNLRDVRNTIREYNKPYSSYHMPMAQGKITLDPRNKKEGFTTKEIVAHEVGHFLNADRFKPGTIHHDRLMSEGELGPQFMEDFKYTLDEVIRKDEENVLIGLDRGISPPYIDTTPADNPLAKAVSDLEILNNEGTQNHRYLYMTQVNYNKGKAYAPEYLPHFLETKQGMLDKGIIKNRDAEISTDDILKYFDAAKFSRLKEIYYDTSNLSRKSISRENAKKLAKTFNKYVPVTVGAYMLANTNKD